MYHMYHMYHVYHMFHVGIYLFDRWQGKRRARGGHLFSSLSHHGPMDTAYRMSGCTCRPVKPKPLIARYQPGVLRYKVFRHVQVPVVP